MIHLYLPFVFSALDTIHYVKAINDGVFSMKLAFQDSVNINVSSNILALFQSTDGLDILIQPDDSNELGPFSSDKNFFGILYRDRTAIITVTATNKNGSPIRMHSLKLVDDCDQFCFSIYSDTIDLKCSGKCHFPDEFDWNTNNGIIKHSGGSLIFAIYFPYIGLMILIILIAYVILDMCQVCNSGLQPE